MRKPPITGGAVRGSSSIRGVIFDRDGVLTAFDYEVALDLFRGIGAFRLEEALVRWTAWYRAAAAPRTEAEDKVLLTGFLARLADEWGLSEEVRCRLLAFDYLRMIKPYPDARRALLAARARGLRVGVLSNFPLASLPASLRRAGFDGMFDVAASAPVIGAAKPEPRAYEYVLAALGVRPEECVLVDDELPCVEGARAIGIRAYLIDRKKPGAPGSLPDLDALIPLLGSVAIKEVRE